MRNNASGLIAKQCCDYLVCPVLRNTTKRATVTCVRRMIVVVSADDEKEEEVDNELGCGQGRKACSASFAHSTDRMGHDEGHSS